MVVSPIEIETYEFNKSFRGYNKEEVDRFLDKILKDYDVLYRENAEHRDTIKYLEEMLNKYTELEKILNETLVLAQKTAEDTKKNAENEGDLIVAEAKARAVEIIKQAEGEIAVAEQELRELNKQKLVFTAEFKTLILSQLEIIDGPRNDNPEENNEGENEGEEDQTGQIA